MNSFLSYKSVVFGLAVLAMFCCCITQARAIDVTDEAALNFVVKQNAGGNLLALAKAAARRTQTFSMLAAKLGKERASALVDEQIVAVIPEYQPTWYRKMASVYATYFSEGELKSLAEDGLKSKYAAKWDAQRDKIGADIRANSQYILSRLLARALENAVIKAGGLGSTEARRDSQSAGQS
jgi:hypothetical protein